MKSTAILIPARYASERLPGKPLVMLGDKPMIQHVVEQCKLSGHDVYVLTDNKIIAQAAKAAGAGVYISTNDFANGTERCADAIRSTKFDKYTQFINVQGDMPDVTVEIIDMCVRNLKNYIISTICTQMPDELQSDPNTVKCIRYGKKVLWMARGITGYGDWHLGIYGYHRTALEQYTNLNVSLEEKIEKLEQLRWIKGGWTIGAAVIPLFNGIEINTAEDAERWNNGN